MVGDVRDADAVASAVRGADVVVHLAAFLSVFESFLRPGDCFEINVQGTLNVAEGAARAGVRRLVCASSSAVYGAGTGEPLAEGACPLPESPYAVSKLEDEHILAWFGRRRGLASVAFRYFNVYGPRQNADSDYSAVIPLFLQKSFRGLPLTIYGDGLQTRDFVHVSDVAAANAAAVKSACSGVFNVGTGDETTILDLARAITDLARSQGQWTFAPARAGDVRASTASLARIVEALDWRPRRGLREGLVDCADWWRKGSIEETEA